MFEEKVMTLLREVLEENPNLFLIDFKVSPDQKIQVIIDGDQGVSVQDCMTVSRHIEHNLDREETDFALEVSSAGATTPLQHQRQFQKNVGRKLQVKAQAEKLEGTLESADDNGITLSWKAREPKPVGKGKVTVEKKQTIAYHDIEEAKVKIVF